MEANPWDAEELAVQLRAQLRGRAFAIESQHEHWEFERSVSPLYFFLRAPGGEALLHLLTTRGDAAKWVQILRGQLRCKDFVLQVIDSGVSGARAYYDWVPSTERWLCNGEEGRPVGAAARTLYMLINQRSERDSVASVCASAIRPLGDADRIHVLSHLRRFYIDGGTE